MKARIFFIVLLCAYLPSSAQEIRTNEQGEKIIVYPNGSWRPYDPLAEDPFGESPTDDEQVELIPADPKERQAYLDQKSRERATRAADHATNRTNLLRQQYQRARQRRIALEEELANMKKLGKFTDKQAQQHTERQWKFAVKAEKTAYKRWQKARKHARRAEQMIDAPYKKREKWLAKTEDFFTSPQEHNQHFTQLDFGPPENYAHYDPRQDPLVHPPPYTCHIVRDETDRFTGKRRRDMAMEELFAFTPPPLRHYMKGRTFIRCSASISDASEGLAYLTLHFHIASPNAHKSFGGIPRGNFILLQTLDGTQIRLRNTVNDPGSYRASDGSYTFRAQCTLSAGQQDLLKKSEIDRMRVFWLAGYEDYEIYRVNFFKNQLNCLYP